MESLRKSRALCSWWSGLLSSERVYIKHTRSRGRAINGLKAQSNKESLLSFFLMHCAIFASELLVSDFQNINESQVKLHDPLHFRFSWNSCVLINMILKTENIKTISTLMKITARTQDECSSSPRWDCCQFQRDSFSYVVSFTTW